MTVPRTRRPQDLTRRPPRWLVGVVAAVAAFALVLGLTGNLPWEHRAAQVAGAGLAAPWEFSTSAWDAALGGDAVLTAAQHRQLSAWQDPTLSSADRDRLKDLGEKVAEADLTARGRDSFAGYWPPASRTGVPAATRCLEMTVLASSPALLPTVKLAAGVSRYAKVLITYSGTCGSDRPSVAEPGIEWVYAAETEKGWVPVHSWDVPAPDPGPADPQAAVEPAEWELKQFDSCASPDTVYRDRIIVVDAFSLMCAAARKAGVELVVTAAYRTRAEQAALFDGAVKSYGSEAEARKWVAYADDQVCTSRHCSGVALDVQPTSQAISWLNAVVGCNRGSVVSAATTCPAGSTPVPRLARYGFAAPLANVPGYLEFTLPLDAGDTDSASAALSSPDCSPQGVPVPNMVAAIFRCRLAREGVVGIAQDEVVSQALVVSRCESGWNSGAKAYAGRFDTAPNPVDGHVYTEQGVFMISAELADLGWLSGGAGARSDPVANINAAASLWLSTRGWEQFGCATGTTGGFESGPVLPGYGGPALPSWSNHY